MMLHMMFQSINTFLNSGFTERFHFLVHRCFLFTNTIVVCSFYRVGATFKLLCNFGFVCALILGYAAFIFHTSDAKYLMFCVGWCRSLKSSATPALTHSLIHLFVEPKIYKVASFCVTVSFWLKVSFDFKSKLQVCCYSECCFAARTPPPPHQWDKMTIVDGDMFMF